MPRIIGVCLVGLLFGAGALALPGQHKVKSGLDVLVDQQFAPLKDKQVGIVCNHTSVNKAGVHLVDLIQNSRVCRLKAIFAPEHGFRGNQADGSTIADSIDMATGARIYSLYGKVNRPTSAMLEGIDLLIYDIQDVGVRFYTYITTMTYVLESAAAMGIPVMVLDRPNPVRGDRIEGPMLDLRFRSFVGAHPLPVRYGLTVGELATLINAEGWLADGVKADLTVIRLQGWQRGLWYDETDLPWIPPSPNMKSVETAVVYPGFCLIEGTNLSEGRGTAQPFLQFGAPWIEAASYTRALQQLQLPGVRFEPVSFTPRTIPGVATQPKYEGQLCQGVRLVVTDRQTFRPLEAVIKVLVKTKQLYPNQFQIREAGFNRLFGNDQWQKLFVSGESDYDTLINGWQPAVAAFQQLSARYYLY